MIKKIINTLKEDYFFLIITTLFIVIKIPYLSLPYFWDEAWAYGNAVNYLYDNSISLSPDAAPDYFTRGHPLLLHAIVAGVMKIFGQTPFVAHSFMLFMSSGFLVMVYYSIKNFAEKSSALFIVAMLMVLPAFYTQSVLVLSEIWLILFSFLLYLCYQNDRNILYMITGCFALLIKESAVIVLITFLFLFILENKLKFKNIFSAKLFFLILPFFFWGIYLLWQHSVKGWYFYPEHTSEISFSITEIIPVMQSYLLIVFFNDGRFIWTAIVIASLVYQKFVLKNKNSEQEKKLFLFSVLFIFLFLVFSSIYFYSPRYILIVSVTWIISSAYFTLRVLRFTGWVNWSAIIVIGFFGVLLFNLKKINDTSPGYKNGALVVQQIIPEVEKMNIYNENIYAPFLIRENLLALKSGYRQTENQFVNLKKSVDEADYAITDNYEEDEVRNFLENSPEWFLLKECKVKNAEASVYKRKSKPESAGN